MHCTLVFCTNCIYIFIEYDTNYNLDNDLFFIVLNENWDVLYTSLHSIIVYILVFKFSGFISLQQQEIFIIQF